LQRFSFVVSLGLPRRIRRKTMQNDPLILSAIALGVVIVLAVTMWFAHRRNQRRSAALREHFAGEYEREVAQHGRARAERALEQRQKRYEKLDIRLLSTGEQERFAAAWSEVQQRFVDDPAGAVYDADALVKQVMSARGYPMGNFEQRAADLSVEHANVIHHYRAARTIAQNSAAGQAGTEDLRQGLVHYRALFSDLLVAHPTYGELQPARLSRPASA
jgi:hypothetical protein